MAATTAFVESSGIVISVGAGILSSLLALSMRFSKDERQFFFVACITLLGTAFVGSTDALEMLFLPVVVVISTALVLYALKLALRAKESWLRMSVMFAYAVLFAAPLISVIMMTIWLVGESTGAPSARPF